MDGRRNVALLEAATEFFAQRGFRVEKNVALEGNSGLEHSFDLLLSDGRRERTAVWIMDWSRTVGVNMVIKLDRAAADANVRNSAIIAGKFSDHAKAYANRRRIKLIDKREIAAGSNRGN
ncbi:MAG: restriction endonuclease [Candidatus Bathyarchaeia archaeon]